jgi:hypothetical protein
MTYRVLAAFPFVAVAAVGVFFAALPAEARPGAEHVSAEVVKALALVGMAAGALAFGRGDYLRRGWGLSAACYVFLLTRDTWLAADPGPRSDAAEAVLATLVLLANASAVAGTWTLARAWNVAGMDLPGTEGTRRGVIAGAIVASALCAGPSVVTDTLLSFEQHAHYWTIPSDLGDLLALPLLAPVAMTALALREGSLRWTWGLLTTSLAAWLLFDAVVTIPQVLHLDERNFRTVAEACRVLAGTAAFSAGMAQRRAMHELAAV